MRKIAFIYLLTLLSSMIVWYMFGVFATVAAGYSWVPVSAFVAAVIHFGISSWLFLWFPKAGRIVACLTAIALCMWPAMGLMSTIRREAFSLFFFGLPLIISIWIVYSHVKALGEPVVIKKKTKIILTAVPATLFVVYAIYLVRLFT